MTPETGSSASTSVTRVIFLFAVLMTAACGQGEKPVRQDVQPEKETVPLAVKEWYPSPKHASQPQGQPSFTASQLSAPMPAHTINPGYTTQHSWGTPVQQQQPASAAPPPVIVFQGQQYVPVQPQQGWSYQQPVTQPSQPWYQPRQPYAVSVPQAVQRPWGNAMVLENHNQPGAQLQTWPPGNYNAPAWGTNYGAVPENNGGHYWTLPPANNYGSVW